jgi:hypothetical protein
MNCCWSYFLICIVTDHDINIAAKQWFSCTNALCYLSNQSSYHMIHINIQLGRFDSGAAWQSSLLRMEWLELFGGRNNCGRKDLCQAMAVFMVAATRLSTLYNNANLNWVQLFLLFSIISLFCSVMEKIQCFLCKYYNLISHLMLLIILHIKLWLLQTSCSIFIDIVCCSNSHVFDTCFTISMNITVILAVMLKYAILVQKNSNCP